MTYDSLAHARGALYARRPHYFVHLLSGRWSVCLGAPCAPPAGCTLVRGDVYRQVRPPDVNDFK